MPTRPQKAEKRTSGSAKLCAVMAVPHRQTDRRRTGCRSAHCRSRRPIRGRSAARWRHRRLPLAETRGRAYGGLTPGGAKGSPPCPALPGGAARRPPPAAAAPAGAPRTPPHLPPERRHPARHQPLRKNSFMLQSSRSHPPPRPCAQPGWAHIPPCTRGAGGGVSAASGPSGAAPPGGLSLRQVTWGPAGARS